MPLRLLGSRNVAGANVIQVLFVAGMFSTFFLGALFLQRVLGYSALEVGLAFLPMSVVIGTLALGFSERLVMRFGPKATLLPSLVLIAASLAWLARVPVDATYVTDLLPAMILLGFGAGLAFPSLMGLSMSSATPSDAGLASGLANTTLQVGGAIGIAVLATLATDRTESLLTTGADPASALTDGYRLAFLVGTGVVVAAIGVAVTVIRSGAQAPDQAGEAAVEEFGPARPSYSEAA
jgi:predicted MFS family arabinose efflux permease